MNDAVFTHNLAVDIIAKTTVDVDFEYVDNAALGLHNHDLRILQTLMRLRRGLGHDALHFVPFVTNQPRQHVNLVGRRIGDSHRSGVIGRNAIGAPNSPESISSLTRL